MAQDVDSDAIQFRSSTQTLQHLRKSDEMPTAPIGKSKLVISAVAGVSHATATTPLTISRS